MVIQQRATTDFTPTQWSTAADKLKFYNHFIHFVQSGYKRTLFPKWFYTRLSLTFGHIAHYNIHGFYDEWFSSPSRQQAFLRHAQKYGCYGDPKFTYCDVERELQKWIAMVQEPAL